MKVIILFLILSLNSTLYSKKECQVDTTKRFENIINYIKKDSLIEKIVYPYHPKVSCFDFPEFVYPDTIDFIVDPNTFTVEYYLWVINDTNKRTIRELFALIDTVKIMMNKHSQKEVFKTNYIKTANCESQYEFDIGFNIYGKKEVWSISLKPKERGVGAYRTITYTFVFDDQDRIDRVWTSYSKASIFKSD